MKHKSFEELVKEFCKIQKASDGDVGILALTGAGISAASGIPTFEDVPGLKDKLTVEFRMEHKKEYKEAVKLMKENMLGKEPNDAHIALAEYNVPVITMNIDGLHQKAGSKYVMEVHGSIEGHFFLYGEIPGYDKAFRLLKSLSSYKGEKVLLVIGTSLETVFANEFISKAIELNFRIININDSAEITVRSALKNLRGDVNNHENERRD